MERLATAKKVYDAVQGFKQAQNAVEWAKANPGHKRIMDEVNRLRVQHG